MSAAAVDVLDYANFDRFHERYYLPNRPVVIRGIRDARPLKIHEWSASYFDQAMGDKVVPVLTTTTGFLSYERNVEPMKFADFVSRSFGRKSDSAVRYYFKNPTTLLPPGHDDSNQIAGLAEYIAKAVTGNLWISGGGLTVGLHFDAAENFNFQLRGRKAFWLYPPGVTPYYPLPMFSQTAHISGVYRNGLNPDLSPFPHFDPSKGVRVDLEAGDVLYLPAYWWHQVQSLGDENVNLNFWWIPAIRKQMPNWNQALRGHFQLAIRLLKFGNIQKAPTESKKADT
jgi:hypothetical protein